MRDTLLTLGILLVVSTLFLSFSYSLTKSLRITVGLLFLLWLPGWTISLIFWPMERLSWIERLVLSLTLSLATIPMLMFVMGKFGFQIGLTTTVIEVLAVTAVAAGAVLIGRRWPK